MSTPGRRAPLRVLYINPFAQQVSGPDESLLTLLGTLIPLGVQSHLVLPRPGPQVPRYEALGVKVHYAPLTILRRGLGLGAALLPLQLARGVTAITTIARRERVDLIHTNMEVVLDGTLASRALRIPHVLHYRGNTNDEPKLVFDILTRFWASTAATVFCISDATAAIFLKRRLRANVETLYNPVDVDAFSSAVRSDEVRNELGAAPADVLVGTVARIHPRKDLETFIRAAALVARERHDVRFVVVGSAETSAEKQYERLLRALVSQLDLEGRLVWAGARRDMPAVMQALDVFVLCSRHEGFGRVIAEALAAGRRVVGSAEGAIPELLSGSRGRVAQARDQVAFARAILGSLDENPPLEAISAFARSSFSPSLVAARVYKTYLRCLASNDAR